jgi:hypothetical protein
MKTATKAKMMKYDQSGDNNLTDNMMEHSVQETGSG